MTLRLGLGILVDPLLLTAFSAMEIETAVRSALPLLIFVINNNGIYFGLDAATYKQTKMLPSTALTPDTRYDLIAEVSCPHVGLADEFRLAEGKVSL